MEENYEDIRDSGKIMLTTNEDVIFRWLGFRAFQIEKYGYYKPNIILEIDFYAKGKETFQKHIQTIKSVLCHQWKGMRKSELLKDSLEVFLIVIGVLLAKDVPRAIAIPIAGIIARRGIDWLCK